MLRFLPLLVGVQGGALRGLTAQLNCSVGERCGWCNYWNQCWIEMELEEWMPEPGAPPCPDGTTALPGGCFYCGCNSDFTNAAQCQAAGGSWCGLTTTPTSSTTTTTTKSLLWGDGRSFQRLGEACRGSSEDDDPNYETLDVGSLEACRQQCLQRLPRCTGIEFRGGKCEIWTRQGGIFNTAPMAGAVCERFGWPVEQLYLRGMGMDCKGDHAYDESTENFVQHWHVRTLADCKARCAAAPVCFGLEYDYKSGMGRCMVWKRPIRASTWKSGHQCLAFPEPRVWQSLTTASGTPGPCRGLSPHDNHPKHFAVLPMARWQGLADCRAFCLRYLRTVPCKAVEFSEGRCELWKRQEGVYHVAENLPDFTCERWGWPVQRLQRREGACRGDHSNDNSLDYAEVHEATHGLEDCRARCAAASVCFGVEFAASGGRCEVWNRPIRATKAVAGHECWVF